MVKKKTAIRDFITDEEYKEIYTEDLIKEEIDDIYGNKNEEDEEE